MAEPVGGDEGVDALGGQGAEVGFAEVAGVGQKRFGQYAGCFVADRLLAWGSWGSLEGGEPFWMLGTRCSVPSPK